MPVPCPCPCRPTACRRMPCLQGFAGREYAYGIKFFDLYTGFS